MSQDTEPYDRSAHPQPELRRRSVVEQHAQSVLLAIITAAVLYSGSFVVQAREEAVRWAANADRLGSKVDTLTTEVAAVRAQISVMQQSNVSREDFRDHESRLRQLEQRARK